MKGRRWQAFDNSLWSNSYEITDVFIQLAHLKVNNDKHLVVLQSVFKNPNVHYCGYQFSSQSSEDDNAYIELG